MNIQSMITSQWRLLPPKIPLMGNPNVGKSSTFSWLTGIVVISANYPGTVVVFSEGRMNWRSVAPAVSWASFLRLVEAIARAAPPSMHLESYLKTRDVPAMTRSGRRPRRFCAFIYSDHNIHCSWRSK
jgi:hypothetical protein